MVRLTLDKDTILKRINGIQNEIGEMEKLSRIPFEEFKEGVGFKLAQFHLHRSLEGVFHIGAHILSRIPGGQVSEYKEMAMKLGEYNIVDRDFANTTLKNMAGYRNRIVHFYAEISPEEIYRIINNNLGDFDIFLKGVKRVLGNPEKFGI
ncbi:MAG: DUF86 domain-containing protein [Nitrospinae bacterium]|nr:DUF86 domain-containing protein [Nitrospinota bacterium]MBI3815648.1 DUF86 domain-containing protein [Nitrospinota bacterium]